MAKEIGEIGGIGEPIQPLQAVELDSGLVPFTPYHAKKPGGGRIFCSPQWVRLDGNIWVAIANLVKQLPNNGWKVDIPDYGYVEIHPDIATNIAINNAKIKDNIGVHFGPELRIVDIPNILRWTLTKNKDAKQIENGDVQIATIDNVSLGMFFNDWYALDKNLVYDNGTFTINLEQAKDELSDLGLESINLDPSSIQTSDWSKLTKTDTDLVQAAVWAGTRGDGTSTGTVTTNVMKVQADNVFGGAFWTGEIVRIATKFASGVPFISSAELTCTWSAGRPIENMHVSVADSFTEPIANAGSTDNYGKIFTAYNAGGNPLGLLDTNGKIAIPPSSWADPLYVGFVENADQTNADPGINVDRVAFAFPPNAGEPQIDYILPVEIEVWDGTVELTDGVSIVDFGDTPVGVTVTKRLTIKNTGDFDLNITSQPTATSDYTRSDDLDSLTIASGGGEETFDIRFDASSPGSASGVLTIISNDADEGTFTFTITGTATSSYETIPDGLLPYYLAASDASELVSSRWYLNLGKKHAFSVHSDYEAIINR